MRTKNNRLSDKNILTMAREFKCKQCWERHNTEEVVMWWINRFCSKSCRLEFARKAIRKAKDKQKLKQTKKKEKKANSSSVLTKKADKLWSEAVKIEYNYECQYCWKTEYLNSHHLYTRSRRATRWDIDNGICLCSGCHTMSSIFSAHRTPLEFYEWLEWIRWSEWISALAKKSRAICNITPDLIKKHISELELYIKENKNELK